MDYMPEFLKKRYEEDCDHCKDLDIDTSYINISDVLRAHYILADYFTDDTADQQREHMLVGVRSFDLLASAVGRQVVEFGGKRKYTKALDICATLFFGLVKDHAFFDGNKRTALLVLLYQLQKYSYYPKKEFKNFERLVVATADNKLSERFKSSWRRFGKKPDPEIHAIAYELKKLVVKKDTSFHMDLTTKEFCKLLANNGVQYRLDGQKLKLERELKGFFKSKKLAYSIGFYGWTRPVRAKMARDVAVHLELLEEFPSYESMVDPDSNIYSLINEFENPLRRLKDK